MLQSSSGGGSAWSRGGVCLVGGSPCQGGSDWSRGGGLPGDPLPPPVNRITDTCKNITLATTSLRPVINNGCYITVTVNSCSTSTIILKTRNIRKKLPLFWYRLCLFCPYLQIVAPTGPSGLVISLPGNVGLIKFGSSFFNCKVNNWYLNTGRERLIRTRLIRSST